MVFGGLGWAQGQTQDKPSGLLQCRHPLRTATIRRHPAGNTDEKVRGRSREGTVLPSRSLSRRWHPRRLVSEPLPPVLHAPPGNGIRERTGRLFLGGGGGGVQRGTLERRKVMSMPTPRACLKSCWRVTAGLLEAGRTLGYCLERRHHAVPVMSPHMCQSKPYV